MDRQAKLRELQELKQEVTRLEAELGSQAAATDWSPKSYYTTYHLLAGMVLGFIAASASLLFNIIGATLTGKHPLELIRIYLTFPLGESALDPGLDNSYFFLAAGCCLYLGTGMFGGIPFHLLLSRWFARASIGRRFIVATMLGLGVWLINFYGILSWLQPLLIGGRWILQEIPWYVAAATHLVFGWTMLAVDHWGRFVPHAVPMTEELS